ncbi:MAG: NYN domain-containing protein [Candidatus Pacebacteria bacterium]|nr:NYN domain-containing protein [Candidatus Paceibacterota bacterium]
MKPANNSNQRVGIFVDVSNLYHSAKNLYQGRVNYAELIKYLVGGRQLIRALAYVVKSEGVEPQHAHTAGRPPQHAARMPEKDQIAAVSAAPVPASDMNGGNGTGSSESSFFEALEKAGLELRMKDLQIFAGGMKKGDWDVGMAVDAIRMMPSLDVVILVTGDGDFIPLVNYLKWGGGKVVEVASFRRSASSKIVEAADTFINIEAIPRVIMRSRLRR